DAAFAAGGAAGAADYFRAAVSGVSIAEGFTAGIFRRAAGADRRGLRAGAERDVAVDVGGHRFYRAVRCRGVERSGDDRVYPQPASGRVGTGAGNCRGCADPAAAGVDDRACRCTRVRADGAEHRYRQRSATSARHCGDRRHHQLDPADAAGVAGVVSIVVSRGCGVKNRAVKRAIKQKGGSLIRLFCDCRLAQPYVHRYAASAATCSWNLALAATSKLSPALKSLKLPSPGSFTVSTPLTTVIT